jgi:hypothetical protein
LSSVAFGAGWQSSRRGRGIDEHDEEEAALDETKRVVMRRRRGRGCGSGKNILPIERYKFKE